MPENHPSDRDPQRSLKRSLLAGWREASEKNFEKVFIMIVLASVGCLTAFVDDKLAFLDFYFIPVLLAAYFLNLRSAVLGGVLSVLWVGFSVLLDPEAFYMPPSPETLYLHLVAWGSFLILCGALVGRLNEQLLERFARLKEVLRQWREAQARLDGAQQGGEEKASALEGLRARMESVVYSSMDAVTAQLAVQDRLPMGPRQATVLWAELSGAEGAAKGAKTDDWFAEVNSALAQIEPVVAAYQGHLDRFAGAGLIAEFGLAVPSAQSGLLGVAAALTMQQKAKQKPSRWPLKIALADGPVVAGLLGAPPRRSYTAVGEAVDLAARLRELCPPDKVCVSPAIHDLVHGGVHSRPILGKDQAGRDLRRDLLQLEARIDYSSAALEDYLEAGRLSLELGDHDRSVAYYVMALNLNPRDRSDIEGRIHEVKSKAAAAVAHKSAPRHAQAYEILGLRDPLEDALVIPVRVRLEAEASFVRAGLHAEMLLPLEAVKGSVGHSRVSAALSAALASAMGLSDEEVRAAFLAGFFHEVGLKNLPQEVGDKDESMPNLARRDLELLRTHPSLAKEALDDLGLEVPPAALEAIRQHLENLDGSGPQRLPGGAVSLLARVVRVAHEYDRLTSWRPYRKPWSQAAALNAMRLDAEANRKLDAKVLEVLDRVLTGSRRSPQP